MEWTIYTDLQGEPGNLNQTQLENCSANCSMFEQKRWMKFGVLGVGQKSNTLKKPLQKLAWNCNLTPHRAFLSNGSFYCWCCSDSTISACSLMAHQVGFLSPNIFKNWRPFLIRLSFYVLYHFFTRRTGNTFCWLEEDNLLQRWVQFRLLFGL